MNTVSQVTAFVYAKVFAAMPSSISMNCYASSTRQRLNLEGQRDSRDFALIAAPRINAELSEELGEPIFRRRRVSAGGNDRHLSAGPYELGRTSEC